MALSATADTGANGMADISTVDVMGSAVLRIRVIMF
jgi:hypothetical protein